MKKLLSLSLIALLAGCATQKNLDSSVEINPKESVFVFGMKPDKYHLFMFAGDVKHGTFRKGSGAAVFSDTEKDGYIVGKAEAGQFIAITQVGVKETKDSSFSSGFSPCDEAKTMVFKLPEGKVLYLGDLSYFASNKTMSTSYSENFPKAQLYIDSAHPRLKGRLEPYKPEFMPTSESCKSKFR